MCKNLSQPSVAQNIRVMATCCDLSVGLSEVRGGGGWGLFCVLKGNDVVTKVATKAGSEIPEFPD